jgi:hypothetical protein
MATTPPCTWPGGPFVWLAQGHPTGGAAVGSLNDHRRCQRVAQAVDGAVPALADLRIVVGGDLVQLAALFTQPRREVPGGASDDAELLDRDLGPHRGIHQQAQGRPEVGDRLPTHSPRLSPA